MLFDPYFLVWHLRKFMGVEPGAVIDTGPPPGVGMGLKPPVWLQPGDVMELGIDGLGRQRQLVVAPRLRTMALSTTVPLALGSMAVATASLVLLPTGAIWVGFALAGAGNGLIDGYLNVAGQRVG